MATIYIPKIDDQDIINLQALVLHPGYISLLKLLDVEVFRAQAEAMQCKNNDPAVRLQVLTEAQVTSEVSSNLKVRLDSFKIEVPTESGFDPLQSDFGVQ